MDAERTPNAFETVLYSSADVHQVLADRLISSAQQVGKRSLITNYLTEQID